jgi:importin subunit alpha-1
MILKCGGLEPLLHVVNNTTSKLIIKHGTWAISNLCRGKPLPDLKLVEAALPTMSAVVQKETETEVITDAMWALSYLTRIESKIQPTIESGVVPSLIHHLR